MTATMPRGALPPPYRPPPGSTWREPLPSTLVQHLRQRLHDVPPEPPVAPPPPPPPPDSEPEVRDPPSPDEQAPVRDPPRNPAVS
jgi:hypothetical protein